MNAVSLIKFILSHPINRNSKAKALSRFIKWQLNTKLNPYPIIYPFTENSKLIIQKGMTGATQNLYCGLQEFEDMAFLIHFLRKEDFFVDIGANIGSFTVLAAGHIGSKTYSFEPVPSTFSHLLNNISVNNISKKVTVFNTALGSAKGKINFTSSLDTMNHVANNNETGTISVPIEKLDEILPEHETPLLLKIDVEGFETEVIRGASHTLRQSRLKAIIIELNGSGSRYGYDESKIHDELINLQFRPFRYEPMQRILQSMDGFGSHNTIYIRDLDFVQKRLSTAPKTKILDIEI